MFFLVQFRVSKHLCIFKRPRTGVKIYWLFSPHYTVKIRFDLDKYELNWAQNDKKPKNKTKLNYVVNRP